jgi:hypothetical protein
MGSEDDLAAIKTAVKRNVNGILFGRYVGVMLSTPQKS